MKKTRVALFGECMIELRGELFGTMQQTFGGDTLNTAVYLARLGKDYNIDVAYATQLGTDDFSGRMISAWQEEGIDTSMVRRVEGKMPGLYTIQVDSSGERTFYYWRDMSAAKDFFLGQGSLLEDQLDQLDVLYFSGISLAVLPDSGRDTLLRLAETMKTRGGKIFFDNNYRPRVWRGDPATQDWYNRAFSLADLALITLDDHAALYGLDMAAALEHALSLNCPELVIKRGLEPTLVKLGAGKAESVATFKVNKVVDTTGAGDSFAGAYLAARLAGQEPSVAAKYGNKLASIVIQHPGAIIPSNAMPVFFFG